MRSAAKVDERAEIRVEGHEDAPLSSRHPQQSRIAWIGRVLAGFPHVVPLLTQPFRKTARSAAIDEESHPGGTFTASSRSFATTACA